ncbi:hypothetical protein PPYR_14073 [Photinus pyralis]|uniref:Aminotransferase class I/classII large domain-containing protein n=1 Tax=Photinus pyralis TaxID=7054 RepID=A0A5N4A488_PHOPY|nr:hypothetical protein PPYR_14073 [Photinus pyralis]
MENFEIDFTYFINPPSLRRRPFLPPSLVDACDTTSEKSIKLAEGFPNDANFPFKEISVLLKDGTSYRLEGEQLATSLHYIPTKGYPPLVSTLKDFTQQIHQPPYWSQRDVLVTVGSQEAMSKVLEMCLEEGDPILVQNPLYSGIAVVLAPFQSTLIPINQDGNGMVPDFLRQALNQRKKECLLDRQLKMPKILYINPTGANPVGTTLPLDRRQEIYRICCDYNILILEDDPYCFMNYKDPTPPSFLSFDIEGRVIRLDSLSKVLCPGLRIGWVTAAKPLTDVLELGIENCYLSSASLTQVITYNLLNGWGVKGTLNYFRSVRDDNKKRRDMMLQSMDLHLKGLCDWSVPDGGMFAWIKVRDIPEVQDMLLIRGKKKCVTFAPGRLYMVDSQKTCSYIRASFCRENPKLIDKAMQLLAELILEEKALLKAQVEKAQ